MAVHLRRDRQAHGWGWRRRPSVLTLGLADRLSALLAEGLTVAEVAARAGVNSSTLATWLHRKRLDAVLVANGLPPGGWPGRWTGD